jgi:hypothetical protein
MILLVVAAAVTAYSFATVSGLFTASAVSSVAADASNEVDVSNDFNLPTIGLIGISALAGALFLWKLWRIGFFDINRRTFEAERRLRVTVTEERDIALANLAAEQAIKQANLAPLIADYKEMASATIDDLSGIRDVLEEIRDEMRVNNQRRRRFDTNGPEQSNFDPKIEGP